MWKREGYCQGGVSSTPGAGGRGSPGSRSHISGRERPALPPCSLKLASLPRPPGSACRLLIPDASLDHVPPCPLPHSRLPPAPFSPLYSRVAPRGDQGSSRSPPGGARCGGGRAPRPLPACAPSRGQGALPGAGGRDQSQGEREGEAGPKGRRGSGHPFPSPLRPALSAGEGPGPPSSSRQSPSCEDP